MRSETHGKTCGGIGFRLQRLATVCCNVKASGEVVPKKQKEIPQRPAAAGGDSAMTTVAGS